MNYTPWYIARDIVKEYTNRYLQLPEDFVIRGPQLIDGNYNEVVFFVDYIAKIPHSTCHIHVCALSLMNMRNTGAFLQDAVDHAIEELKAFEAEREAAP